MFKPLTEADITALPEHARKHVQAAVALTARLNQFLNEQGQPAAVVLDAVFNLYANAVVHHGVERDVAPTLAQLSALWLSEEQVARPASASRLH